MYVKRRVGQEATSLQFCYVKMCHVNTTYFQVVILNFGKHIGSDTLVGFIRGKDFALDTDSILYRVLFKNCRRV